MAQNPGVIKAVIELHRRGHTFVAIAKTLNLHIEEVVNIIHTYG